MPLAFALALSALLHAAAITMPGWELPGQDGAAPPLEARLAPAPAAAGTAPAKAKPSPRPVPTKKPAAVAAGPAPAPEAPSAETETVASAAAPVPTAAESAAAPPEPVPVKAAEAPPPATPPAPPWPRTGRVHYVVTYGEHGFIIGEMVHEWRIDGGHYMIHSLAEPKGLAALRGRTRRQQSAGELTAEGLRPSEFRDQQEGREQETAQFDWPAARVLFSGGRGAGTLGAGTQDLLSVFYQLAWQAPRHSVDLSVATARRVGHWTFEWLGEGSVKLAAADLPALHLRTRADGDTTEVWLAPAYGGLPLKIRYTDRQGDVFEQAADSIEFN